MAKQKTGAPTTKVMSGSLGAAVATIVVWVLGATGASVPSGMEFAITTVVTFIFGYFTPSANGDIAEPT